MENATRELNPIDWASYCEKHSLGQSVNKHSKAKKNSNHYK
jgi:hypothetical protein